MAGRLMEFAGWLATQVFDVVGAVAGEQGADGGATVHLQVGKTVFFDVPAKMRAELWLSQLHRKEAGHGAFHSAGEYYDLLFEELDPEVLAEIDKDTNRTFPGHTWLTSPAGQKAMLNVLRAYALSDPEIGYTQGMNFLVGLLLTYLPSEANAFGALSLLMHQRCLREMYLPDMSLLQIRLWQLSKLLPPRLAAHLEAHAALPVLYASSWLLTCFAADFPLHFAARVMDVLMTGHAAASPMLKVAVGIVTACEATLLSMNDFEQMINYLRQDVPLWSKLALHDLLTDALSTPWSPRQLRVLDQMNGAETVMEAVTRVNKLVSQPTAECAEAAMTAALETVASGPAPAALVAGQRDKQQQQQQQAQDHTPRTIARSLSRTFEQPKPRRDGSGKAAVAAWASWKAAPNLESLPTQRVRIDRSFGDVVQLDPQLSQALSVYSPLDGSRCNSAAATASQASLSGQLAAMPEVPEVSEHLQHPRADGQAAAAPAASTAAWHSVAHQSSTHLKGCPSPFDAPRGNGSSTPRGLQQQPQQQQPSLAAGASLAHADAAAVDGSPRAAADSPCRRSLGSSGSPHPLVDLSEQRRELQQLETDAAADAFAAQPNQLQSFLSLFGRSSPSDDPKRGSDGTAAAVTSGSPFAGNGGEGGELGIAGRQGQQEDGDTLTEWSSFKTAFAYEQSGVAGAACSGAPAGLTSAPGWKQAGISSLQQASLQQAEQPGWPAATRSSSLGQPMHSAADSLEGAAKRLARHQSAAAASPPQRSPQRSPQGSRRLSSEAAQRADSLQEESLAGFLVYVKADAAAQQAGKEAC
ncbi:TBC1 domain family member 1 [Chlorella vulgaris]